MTDELLGLLGLCKKAGKLVLGEEEVIDLALAHKLRLILLASDAAEGGAQKVARCAQEGNAPCVRVSLNKAQLGSAVGRASCAAAGVTDVGFAAAMAEKLSQSDPNTYGELSRRLGQKAAKTVRRRREKQQRKKAQEAKGRKPWAAPPERGKN